MSLLRCERIARDHIALTTIAPPGSIQLSSVPVAT
jgi:hypothetical protein